MRRRTKHARLTVLAIIPIAVLTVLAPGTQAKPSRGDLADAKAKLSSLNERLDVLVEEYLQATLKLHNLEDRLADLKSQADHARSEAARARLALSKRAADAYKNGAGSNLELLFGSSSWGEFSDRLEFLNRMSQDDTDLALKAQVTRQRATDLAGDVSKAATAQRELVSGLAAKKSSIEGSVAEAESLVATIKRALATPVIVSSGGTTSPPENFVDPPMGSGAGAAIAAAQSVLGVRYTYAGADPSTGFDCSGLTMWSWAHAGVSLPHSSAAQYSVLPHVSREGLQPGDLLFFYSPIHHVGMYLGGGQMIHAPHTGGVVEIIPVYWQYYVGAGRPGV